MAPPLDGETALIQVLELVLVTLFLLREEAGTVWHCEGVPSGRGNRLLAWHGAHPLVPSAALGEGSVLAIVCPLSTCAATVHRGLCKPEDGSFLLGAWEEALLCATCAFAAQRGTSRAMAGDSTSGRERDFFLQ